MNSDLRRFIERVVRRKGAYRAVFLNAQGALGLSQQAVLSDLRRFCCANKPTYRAGPNGIDPIASAVQEGRREVWLRIVEHLHLDDAVILNLREGETNGE